MFDTIPFYILQNLGQPTLASSLLDPDYDGTLGFYTSKSEALEAQRAAEQLHVSLHGTLDDTDFYIDSVLLDTVDIESIPTQVDRSLEPAYTTNT